MVETIEEQTNPQTPEQEKTFREELINLGLEPDRAASIEGALSGGFNLEQLGAIKTKVASLIAELRAEREAIERVPNPIPELVRALEEGVKIGRDGYRGIENLPRWAQRIAATIETAKVVSDKPGVELVKELIERGEIPTGITLEDLHQSYEGGIRFYRQDVAPTLKALGAIPENAPTQMPYGKENGFLLALFKKEGKVTQVERPPEGQYRVGVTEFSKQSKIPGVSVALGIQSDCLEHTQRYFNPDGLPLVGYTRLDFSPAALASFGAPTPLAQRQ